MILGDPYKFAIIIKIIKEWNISEAFGNGVLLFCVDGSIFPKEIFTASLNSEINPLKEKLKNIAANNEIFKMEKEAAFKKIYNITFPEDVDLDNDYQFDITPLSFPADNSYIFAVSDGARIRILASKLKYIREESRHKLKNINVYEAFISMEEMKEIVKELNVDQL